MKFLCWLFGHKTVGGFFNGREYMRVVNVLSDGIGREHAELQAECPRCMSVYRAGKVHIPPDFVRIDDHEVADTVSQGPSWECYDCGNESKDSEMICEGRDTGDEDVRCPTCGSRYVEQLEPPRTAESRAAPAMASVTQ